MLARAPAQSPTGCAPATGFHLGYLMAKTMLTPTMGNGLYCAAVDVSHQYGLRGRLPLVVNPQGPNTWATVRIGLPPRPLSIFFTEFNTFPWESVSILVRSLTLEENPQA